MARERGGEVGVQVGDVRYQVDEVVELLGIFARDGRWGRDEDLALRIIGEPLVVEFLGVGSELRLAMNSHLRQARDWTGNAPGISPDLVLQVDQVSLDLFERRDFSLHHIANCAMWLSDLQSCCQSRFFPIAPGRYRYRYFLVGPRLSPVAQTRSSARGCHQLEPPNVHGGSRLMLPRPLVWCIQPPSSGYRSSHRILVTLRLMVRQRNSKFKTLNSRRLSFAGQGTRHLFSVPKTAEVLSPASVSCPEIHLGNEHTTIYRSPCP
jgi:hypothetical protein